MLGMANIQDTPNPTPPPPTVALLDVADLMRVLDVATSALDGDGSTSTLPDVRPDEAARWIVAAIHDAGFLIVKRAGQ